MEVPDVVLLDEKASCLQQRDLDNQRRALDPKLVRGDACQLAYRGQQNFNHNYSYSIWHIRHA